MRFAAACCNGLSVTYMDSLERGAAGAMADEVRVLVPGGRATTFHAFYRSGTGPRREALLSSQEVCVVPPRQDCGLSSTAPADLTILSLKRSFCEEEARESMGYVPQIQELHAASDPWIRSIGNTLRIGFRVGRPPSAEYLEAISHALARHLNEKYATHQKPVACRGLAPNRLKRVLATIDARLGESIHVADLAAEVHMSPFHFARMFKHTTGQAPHVYITAQRMDRAKALLAQGELTLAEVAQRLGYQTQAHFTGVFHANVGLTPRQYRVRHVQRPQ
jgi:AraC family transcriptional regulator